MKSFLDLIKALYGPKAISSTIGTRTNVIRLPSGKLQKYLSKELNIEAASDAAAQNAYNEMKELLPEVAKMNDAERLVFEGNLRRLKNKLEASGLIQGENVSSGITALESKVEQLKQKGKELEKVTGEKATLTDVLNDLGASQQSMSRLNDEGLVRSTAREILINDIKAGKIKNITVSEAINMEEPLDPFRQIYGEGALEQLDSLIPNLRGLKTEMEAEKLARSKFKFEPDENRLPGSVSIEEGRKAEQEFGINKPAKVSDFKAEATKRTSIDDLIDEYNANQDRLILTDEEGGTAIGYQEFKQLQKRNEEIAKALEAKGISSKIEEAPQAEIIPFRKKPTEPEGKANGGAMGLDYLTGMGPSEGYANGGRIGFQKGTIPKMLEFLIEKLSVEKGFNKGLLERAKPKAIQDLYVNQFGSLPTAEEIANIVNKELKGKKSMETVNPKTGEVTVSTEPVKTARTTQDIEKEIDELTTTPITTLEGQRKYNELHSEFINSLDPRRQKKALDYRRNSLDTENRLILKAEEQGLDFDTFEKLRTGLYGPRKQQTLNYIKTGKVNVEPVKPTTTFEEVQKRYRTAAKAADEIFPNYDTPKTSASELANVMAEQKYGKVFDDISGDKQTELYEEAYNYITSVNRLDKVSPPNRIAPPGQEFNISDPKTAEAFTNFAKENDPEGFKKIQKIVDDINNKNALEEFDPTGRKPNAKGGPAGGLDYLMGF